MENKTETETDTREDIGNIDDMETSPFLKSSMFEDRPFTMTVKKAKKDYLPEKDGTLKKASILGFLKTDKEMRLNVTNKRTMKAMFGKHTSDWIGKRITLIAESVNMGPDRTKGIRIIGSPDIPEAFIAEFEIVRLINKIPKTDHVKRPLGISDPNNHGEFKWIVEPPQVNDKNSNPAPAVSNEVK